MELKGHLSFNTVKKKKVHCLVNSCLIFRTFEQKQDDTNK